MSRVGFGLPHLGIAALVALTPGAAHAGWPGVDVPADASAGESPPATTAPGTPYDVDVALDLGVAGGLFVLVATARLFVDELELSPCPALDCDPDAINPLDRSALGLDLPNAVLASDIAFFGSMALPFAIGALDVLVSGPPDGWAGWSRDVVVYTQTLSVALAVNNVLNLSVRRPRPLVYDERRSVANRLDGNQYLSFPSGHTLVSFAMGTALSTTLTLRHPDEPEVYVPAWVATAALGTTAGVGRVLASEHFPTDVLVGAFTGVGIGLLIPYLHLRDDDADTDAEAQGAGALAWSVAPLGGAPGAAVEVRW